MSTAVQNPVPTTTEKTFTAYTQKEGENYAKNRPGYGPKLNQTVVDHHVATGGQLDTLLDVGCGPGVTARALASYFKHAMGLDPSEGMIANARSIGGVTSATEPIRFEISTAESLGSHLYPPVQDASVDLITASASAHWFDMTGFWPRAAQVLKPGGSVAMWTSGPMALDPEMPNGPVIRAKMEEIDSRDLAPYFVNGNLLTRNLYRDLPLPWTLETPVLDFVESTFLRREWGPDDPEGISITSKVVLDLDTVEKIYGTASPVHRWREAHPEAVGTEQDIVRIMRREIEKLLYEAGVKKGEEKVSGYMTGILLIVKKKL